MYNQSKLITCFEVKFSYFPFKETYTHGILNINYLISKEFDYQQFDKYQ